MTAVDLLDRLKAKGVAVVAEGNRLRLRPASVLSPEDLELARTLKPDLLRLLAHPEPRRPASAYAFPWPDAVADLGPRRVGPYGQCAGCGAGTWVRYGATPLCLAHARARDAGGPA